MQNMLAMDKVDDMSTSSASQMSDSLKKVLSLVLAADTPLISPPAKNLVEKLFNNFDKLPEDFKEEAEKIASSYDIKDGEEAFFHLWPLIHGVVGLLAKGYAVESSLNTLDSVGKAYKIASNPEYDLGTRVNAFLTGSIEATMAVTGMSGGPISDVVGNQITTALLSGRLEYQKNYVIKLQEKTLKFAKKANFSAQDQKLIAGTKDLNRLEQYFDVVAQKARISNPDKVKQELLDEAMDKTLKDGGVVEGNSVMAQALSFINKKIS